METVELSNGFEIPILGLGTYLSRGDKLFQAVESAIDIGYMSFDTAWIYENEQHVAKAIEESGRKEKSFL